MLLAGTIATIATAAALPAAGADTTASFTLTAGTLSISAPTGSVSLGSQAVSSSPSTISGQLGVVTVTDQRGGATSWVASVIVTAFTPTTGPAVTAIPATQVSYAAGTITQSGVTATKPATTDLTGVSPVVNGASTGLSTASWNPTISVTLPANAAPGVYSANDHPLGRLIQRARPLDRPAAAGRARSAARRCARCSDSEADGARHRHRDPTGGRARDLAR